jgi:hypothetical protein
MAEIEAHVASERAKGRAIGIGRTKAFSKPRKAQGVGGGRGRNGGLTADGGGEGGGNGRGPGGNNGRNGKGRSLQDIIDATPPSLGYVEIDTTADITEEEITKLASLEGVAFVEHDVEYVIEEYPRNLRGGPREHVREIMESMAMEQGKLPDFPKENSFHEHEGEEHDGNRKLAESRPYGIDMVNVTHLWDLPPVLDKVKICVIDTGYDLGHPDLPGEAHNVTGWDPTTGTYASGLWYVDGHSHGTHCAGTIGAIGGNDAGVVGVNNDPSRFTFHIGKGLSDGGSGSGTDVLAAVDDCVANGARVISMSLGSSSYQQSADITYQEAYDQNVLVIAAAGNSGSDTSHYPSGYKSVVSVASVTKGGGAGTANYGELSSFSTRNDQTEIAGPGSDVHSTEPRDKGSYGYKSGTSMATPHVAGVAALLISHFPSCTNNQIRNAMIHSTTEPPTGDTRNTAGWDKYYGWGIVNAGMAYELLSMGCEAAGGLGAQEGVSLSQMALGGQEQKQIGCISDDQCADANMCLGVQLCNVTSNTCYVQENSAPNCDDGVKCTIDTCDVSLYDGNNLQSMCVHTPMTCDDNDVCNGIYSCHEDTGTCELDVAAVDCEDGDMCTVNQCVPATGACTTTPKNCDDGNPCTLGDTCDSSTGCVIQPPIEQCCGNFQCEADSNETLSTCPQDCSTSISTPMLDTDSPGSGAPNDGSPIPWSGYAGTLLNLKAKAVGMSITGFGIHCTLPEGVEGTLYMWTKEGNHYDDGAWHSRFMWDRVLRRTGFTCAGEGEKTYVYLDEAIKIAAESMRAFHIYVDHEDLDSVYPTMKTIRFNTCDGGGLMHMYHEDNFIAIHAGSGNRAESRWNSIVSPQVFSGEVLYAVTPADDESDSPTDTPTIAPTTTISPTGTTFHLDTPEEGSSYASADGYMFDVVSKSAETLRILSFNLFFKVDSCDYKMWSRLGGSDYHPDAWDVVSNEPEYWELIGQGNITQNPDGNPIFGHRTTMKHGEHFQIQELPPGETRAFYIAFYGCSADWPLAVDMGENYLGVAAQDEHIQLLEGIKKGRISTTEPISYKNFGSNYPGCGTSGGGGRSFTMRGGSITYDFNGWITPTAAPSGTPTIRPTISFAPTGTAYKLTTPQEGSTSSSAYGYMFDLVSKSTDTIRVLSLDLFFKVGQCDYKMWSRLGSSDPVKDTPDAWDLIGEGVITQNPAGSPYFGHRTKMSYGKDFSLQEIPPMETRAFYVAFFGCSESWPLSTDRGSNYLGVWAEDENIQLLEGIKKGQISATSTDFGYNSLAYTMRGSSINYDLNGGTYDVSGPDSGSTTQATTTTTQATTTQAATTTEAATTQAAAPTTESPTNVPTATPSKKPTTSPTKEPTDAPSTSPTTADPTSSPTSSPSTSQAPTEFVPEVVNDLVNTMGNSCSIVRGLYFDVTAGDKWAKITDVMISTYNTRHIEVYAKQGTASGLETKPCAWERVGETSPTWYSSWKRDVNPPWINGFKPIILAPGQTVSLYLLARTNTYGFCMQRGSYRGPMWQPFKTLPVDSPVGAVSMSWGRTGYLEEPFKPGSTYYPYVLYGGVNLETIQPGTESHSPTMAPTNPTTPGLIEKTDAILSDSSNGLQFDLVNLGSEDIIVNKIGIPISASGYQHIDVWYRDGTHVGSSSGCDHWNNWCNDWKKLAGTTVYSAGSSSLTFTPEFVAIARAASTTSFVIVSPKPVILSSDNSANEENVVANTDLVVKLATSVDDYYGNNVQSEHALPAPTSRVFNVRVDYDIAHSLCAVQEKAPWAEPYDPAQGATSLSLGVDDYDGIEGGEDIDEVVTWHPPAEEGGGGLVTGDGPPMDELLE